MSQCQIDDCRRPMLAHDMCSMHYQRWHTHGDPSVNKRRIHGLRKTPEYYIWSGMLQRTQDKNCPTYRQYGAKGIDMYAPWVKDFLVFYRDMGKRPTSQHSIDRIDNSRGYYPDNCRWATGQQQALNKNYTPKNLYKGIVKTENGKWMAQVSLRSTVNPIKENLYFGRFDDPIEAAIAYDTGAIFFYGNDAKTNIL